MKAGIALGSNLGDRLANLTRARDQIVQLSKDAELVASRIYETDPLDCESDAAQFYNATIEIDYPRSPFELLAELRSIEERLGRPATHARNVSRTIDLDLLYFGDEQIDTPSLRLPHPRLPERRFVLAPLVEIRPELVLANESATVAQLLGRLPDFPRVVPASEQW